MLLQYDRTRRMWSVRKDRTSPHNYFARVILDAPSKGLLEGVFEIPDDAAMQTMEGDALRIGRVDPESFEDGPRGLQGRAGETFAPGSLGPQQTAPQHGGVVDS